MAYIRYSNGKRTLSDCQIPTSGRISSTILPIVPNWVLPQRIARYDPFDPNRPTVTDAELWKANYFRKFPQADANSDGKLTWPELQGTGKNLGLPLLQTPYPANVPKSNRKNPKLKLVHPP